MNTLLPTLEDCFQKGVDARAGGRPLMDNPFCRDSEEWREWRAGWHATLDLDEDSDPASDRLCDKDEITA